MKRTLDRHMQKNEVKYLTNATKKKTLKIDQRPKDMLLKLKKK